jgi:hypothetical protein
MVTSTYPYALFVPLEELWMDDMFERLNHGPPHWLASAATHIDCQVRYLVNATMPWFGLTGSAYHYYTLLA